MLLARELLNDLRKLNIPAVVAGGYVRDMVFGTPPKDMDVVVFGDHVNVCLINPKDVMRVLDNAQLIVEKGILKQSDELLLDGDLLVLSTEYPVDVIEYLIKGSYKGMDVDIIFYKKTYYNAEEVVADFDFNINQGFIELDRVVAPDITTLSLVNLERCTAPRLKKAFLKVMCNYQKNHKMELPPC
jgi:hypothetical protein